MTLEQRIAALAGHIGTIMKIVANGLTPPPVVYDFHYNTAPAAATGGAGSWTCPVPAGAKLADIHLISGGGGGGSGRRGAAGTDRSGGGGGSSGTMTIVRSIPLQASEPNMTVLVGAKGLGGAGQTVDDTNGNDGTNGGTTSLVLSGTYYVATGVDGSKGGGTTVGEFGNTVFGASTYIGEVGGRGRNGNGDTPTWWYRVIQFGTGPGGGGGGVNSANVFGNGGDIDSVNIASYVWSSPGKTTTEGQNGPSPIINTSDTFFHGAGGLGGAGNSAGPGGNGADAIGPGGGGGGGGACVNGFKSGDGGNGGDGAIRVIFYF